MVNIKEQWIKSFEILNIQEMRRILKEDKSVIDSKDNFGWTALIRASIRGRTEIVKLLIEAKANLDLKSNSGYTALMYASIRGHIEIVKLLIRDGANIYVEDKENRTCLHHCLHKNNIELTDCFYDKGLTFNAEKHKDYENIKEETHYYFKDYEGYREYRMINEEK